MKTKQKPSIKTSQKSPNALKTNPYNSNCWELYEEVKETLF